MNKEIEKLLNDSLKSLETIMKSYERELAEKLKTLPYEKSELLKTAVSKAKKGELNTKNVLDLIDRLAPNKDTADNLKAFVNESMN